jgi:hypothetical protein
MQSLENAHILTWNILQAMDFQYNYLYCFDKPLGSVYPFHVLGVNNKTIKGYNVQYIQI